MTGWTEERRRKQAEAIRRWKPWAKSTGPKTEAGKQASKMNALKHGLHSSCGRELEAALYHNREFLRAMKLLAETDMAALSKRIELLENLMKSRDCEKQTSFSETDYTTS